MLITEYSIWMTVLWSSVLILLFYILRKKSILLDICSVSGVIVLYAFCMIRMVVPAELSWTKVISGGEPYRVLYKALHQRVFSFVYVNDILGLIWITGAVILVLKYIGEYIRLQKFISSIPSVEDERINEILSKVVSTQVPRVVKTGAVSIPCCFGIFKQTVILPDIRYSDEELYYILLHECSHLRNKDILTKALTNILCALYWWNPLVYLLKKDLNQSLEIRCDGIVARKLDKEKRADYLSVMLKLFKDSGSSNELKKYDSSMMQLFEEHSEKMIERFKLVAELKDGRSWIGKLVAWLIAGIVLVLSYSYIIQPKFEIPKSEIEVDEGVYEITNKDSYIIKKKDGSYVLHTENSEMPINAENIDVFINDGFQIVEE